MTVLKKQIKELCEQRVQQRFDEVQQGIAQAQDSLEQETKSSAGDKYETSREMIQQDLNRYQEQLNQVKKDLLVIQRLDLNTKEQVTLGSLVITPTIGYFIAVSLGKVDTAESSYMVVSPYSPIGRLLMGKHVGEAFVFNGISQEIQGIY